jgi:hypothetical protein
VLPVPVLNWIAQRLRTDCGEARDASVPQIQPPRASPFLHADLATDALYTA